MSAADVSLRTAQQRAQRISQGLKDGPFGDQHPEAAKDLSDGQAFFQELLRLCEECEQS